MGERGIEEKINKCSELKRVAIKLIFSIDAQIDARKAKAHQICRSERMANDSYSG